MKIRLKRKNSDLTIDCTVVAVDKENYYVVNPHTYKELLGGSASYVVPVVEDYPKKDWEVDPQPIEEYEPPKTGDILLKEWAAAHGLDESYARQKARRGSLKTAHKIGRDWFIDADEPNIDNRRKQKINSGQVM